MYYYRVIDLLPHLFDTTMTVDYLGDVIGQGAYVKREIERKYGGMWYMCYESTNSAAVLNFSQTWVDFVMKEKENFEKKIAAYSIEYNPISNYDRNESTTETTDFAKEKETHSGTDMNTTTPNTTTTTTYGKYEENTNIATYDDTTKNTSNVERGHETGANDTTSITGTNTSALSHGEIIEKDAKTDTKTITSEISGNIGVTTSQQMLESEISLRQYDILADFLSRFFKAYCVSYPNDNCIFFDLLF